MFDPIKDSFDALDEFESKVKKINDTSKQQMRKAIVVGVIVFLVFMAIVGWFALR